eukprot:6640663-Prymnesium_polylepis.1
MAAGRAWCSAACVHTCSASPCAPRVCASGSTCAMPRPATPWRSWKWGRRTSTAEVSCHGCRALSCAPALHPAHGQERACLPCRRARGHRCRQEVAAGRGDPGRQSGQDSARVAGGTEHRLSAVPSRGTRAGRTLDKRPIQ